MGLGYWLVVGGSLELGMMSNKGVQQVFVAEPLLANVGFVVIQEEIRLRSKHHW